MGGVFCLNLSFSVSLCTILLSCSQMLPVPGAPKRPMCMSQLPKMLSSCRQPALPIDKTAYFKPEDGRHFVVAHNNRVSVLC